jgi:hypothetical protein
MPALLDLTRNDSEAFDPCLQFDKARVPFWTEDWEDAGVMARQLLLGILELELRQSFSDGAILAP